MRGWLAGRWRRYRLRLSHPEEGSQFSADGDAPLQAELFSATQLEQYGPVLAESHRVVDWQGPDQLLARLADNERRLRDACLLLTTAMGVDHRISPAGEWLLDNFYLVDEQMATAKRHLPKGYSRQLPRLKASTVDGLAGTPRVYDMALEVVAHGDGRVDMESLQRFVAAYQTITPLQLGELWAIPIMLRLAVIENVRRIAVRIAVRWGERNLANSWADKMVAASEQDPKSLILVIADMARSNPPIVSSFVAELARRLQGRGPALALPLTWLEQVLGEMGLSIENLVRQENQQQAAAQVAISNSVGSLRTLGAVDWRDFVEAGSLVEQTLRSDPVGVYGEMDFASRDQYRHAVEAIAKSGRCTELEVARQALALALAGSSERPGTANDIDRRGHVGYYLIGQGLPQLEQQAAVQIGSLARLRRRAAHAPLTLYLGAIGAVSLVTGFGLLALAVSLGMPIRGVMPWLAGVAILLASSQWAVAIVNWLVTLWVAAQALPRMNFSKGIPARSRTLVVVPTMLSSAAGIDRLLEGLEVRFLANRGNGLHFALLTDFADAATECLPGDEPLLQRASAGVKALNEKYPVSENSVGDRFFLFHRPRRWNSHDQRWLGYERKRGKLADLNALLLGGTGAAFACIVGKSSGLCRVDADGQSAVKYVITLDTDTQLPRDAAQQFVGAMSHPLNRPRYDAAQRRVVEGYGILQPRVSISLAGSGRSRFAQLYSGEPGIDPYTRAVSDVYQDVFGEGSFIGKGIYDVVAFEQVTAGRMPENLILSHDLLEGCYARAGLLSDGQLYEDYPASYHADVSRRYRWIRGDWQLAGWLRRSVPVPPGGQSVGREPNPLSKLSQWKLADNLRRSLLPLAQLSLLVAGWLTLTSAAAWTAAILSLTVVQPLTALLRQLAHQPPGMRWRQHLGDVSRTAVRQGRQLIFEFACLPYEAWFSTDAIIRTIWRMQVSRRRLLEWQVSGDLAPEAAGNARDEIAATYRVMWPGPALAVLVSIVMVIAAPLTGLVVAPVLLLWAAAPLMAWWLGRPLNRPSVALNATQTHFLHGVARRTWAFFDDWVGSADHALPPDNYQEGRAEVLAHRTSPTNMGLALLANLGAHDLGYLTVGQLIERTGQTLATMKGLARYQGHFYNWYDTQSLQALPPLYISTVDSGNLAGHLLTLRAGLLALADSPIVNPQLWHGLGDTVALVAETSQAGDPVHTALAAFRRQLTAVSATASLAEVRAGLVSLTAVTATLTATIRRQGSTTAEALSWAQALQAQCLAATDDIGWFAPVPELPALSAGGPEPFSNWPAGITLTRLARLDGVLPSSSLPGLSDSSASSREIGAMAQRAQQRLEMLANLAEQAGALAEMHYDFLFDRQSHLLRIGYNVAERRLDTACYDLLASEARLGSFVAIAQGQLPLDHWFSLGRLLTGSAGAPVLLSWSGSMFEYLMPLLVMPTFEHTLLDQTCQAAVASQIDYGLRRGVAWGVSESGYNTMDVQQNYQYRAFGVPGLGLKRGLVADLVIAPYATVLALLVAPAAAATNLQRLAGEGLLGRYGFFEAVDYTPARQRRGQAAAVVRSYMAHHQGMSLLALVSVLLDQPMQRRFAAERQFQAVMLLLQERIPKAGRLYSHGVERADGMPDALAATQIRVIDTPDTPSPAVQLLSNGRYHVMLTQAGGGYSRWRDLAVTRWREDATRDHWGNFCYIRDTATGSYWSAGFQPTLKAPLTYEVTYSEGRAEYRRRDAVSAAGSSRGQGSGEFETYTEVVVSPEDDIELRRLRLTNLGTRRRIVDVTSYCEAVLAPPAADALHPAFSNLFVQTEIVRDKCAILCTRRPRSLGEHAPWLLHIMVVRDIDMAGVSVSYETDRLAFIGRGCTTMAPDALSGDSPLSGSAGPVLDPIMAIRHQLSLDGGQTLTMDMVIGVAETRAAALSLIDKYHDRHLADRVFELSWTHSQVLLRQINATEVEAQLYDRLASSVIYAQAGLRADAKVLAENRRGQSSLWGYAISGDLPIVLLQVADTANIDLVRQLVQAFAYWRLKGLAVDLVIWNEEHAGYRQQLQDQVIGMIASGIEASAIERPGGIFVRLAEQISGEDRILLQSVARIILSDQRGSLSEQLVEQLTIRTTARIPPFRPLKRRWGNEADLQACHVKVLPTTAANQGDLILGNGIGGFTPDGREYLIRLAPGQTTPAPWANVLANRTFGTFITEGGGAYTWHDNAHEFRLTPWQNDPVSDGSGEALYLRDEETGQFWSPTPRPAPAAVPYVVRHGFGYSVFETNVGGIVSELWVYVAINAAVKFSVLKVRNRSGRRRKLTATAYVEWVLGDLPAKTAMHVSTEMDVVSGALLARNPFNAEFSERLAFLVVDDCDDLTHSVSADRTEFIGRNRCLSNPAALYRSRLSGKTGAGLDPCGAVQVAFELADGQARELVFRLGVGQQADDASQLLQRFRGASAARGALEAVWQHWNHTLGAVQVTTPDPALNVLANGWLIYQTMSCRLWGRTGYYQSGGAFGFRDQLQDVMALVHAAPGLVREHLLLSASRQFEEGDVQHWWHPPLGRGVRTHCSDDYLWLPLAVCRYVASSADTGVLHASVPFLSGRALNAGEDSYYDLPTRSARCASLYEHCVLSIRHGLRFGAHGLPLMGSGDWNDGMNRVGLQGKGESIWLGFFLCAVLDQFVPLAQAQGDADFANVCMVEAAQLRLNLEAHGWDGAWYRRAYFDDGSPLGSADNAECRIDAISQSWAVLSGTGDPIRARQAMAAVEQHLVRRGAGLVQLLDPPFDQSMLDPGYIRGYVPGVRENGGQYTHSAVWAAMAFAALGDRERAWDLLTLINPVNHALNPADVARYKVEPYVVSADIYALEPHTGRGGWSWYTGSAGWLYRLIVESLLGLQRQGDRLRLKPCLPKDWPGYTVHYRYQTTAYHIEIRQQHVSSLSLDDAQTIIEVDGIRQVEPSIPLHDDQRDHQVTVLLREVSLT